MFVQSSTRGALYCACTYSARCLYLSSCSDIGALRTHAEIVRTSEFGEWVTKVKRFLPLQNKTLYHKIGKKAQWRGNYFQAGGGGGAHHNRDQPKVLGYSPNSFFSLVLGHLFFTTWHFQRKKKRKHLQTSEVFRISSVKKVPS